MASEYLCHACGCKVSRGNRIQHENGQQHRKNSNGAAPTVPHQPQPQARAITNQYFCQVCECKVVNGNRAQHEAGYGHRHRCAKQPQQHPRPPPPSRNGPVSQQVARSASEHIFDSLVSQLRLLASKKRFASNYFLIVKCGVDLSQLTEHFLTSVGQKYYFGPFRHAKAAIGFFDEKVRECAVANVLEATMTEHLARHAETPNGRTSFKHFVDSCGEKPDNFGTETPQYAIQLEAYDLPEDLARKICNSRIEYFFTREPLFDACLAHLKSASQHGAVIVQGAPPTEQPFALTRGNFSRMLHALVYCEEAEMSNALHRYDMTNVVFRFGLRPDLRRLKVAGLAEKRPSVLVGDQVRAIDKSGRAHIGFVHHVFNEEIDIHFNPDHVNTVSQFAVQFTIKRVDFRIIHRSIDLCQTFLDETITRMDGSSAPAVAVPNDKLNALQRQFVESVLSPTSSALRILWGPPGTGKTTTVVAYLVSLLKHAATTAASREQRLRKIIVCTPSNASADHVASLVFKELRSVRMLRVLAFSRELSTVPEDIRSFTMRFPGPSGRFRMPTEQELTAADIVVVTLGSAGRLFGMFPELRCSHLVIDEAGQATEADFCSGLTFCDSKTERIVLAGDPKQLGPVIQSQACKQFRFHISPLERLTALDAVVHGPCTVELQINYRSHPDILQLVNVAYGDLLLPPPPSLAKFRQDLPRSLQKARVRWLHITGTEGAENDSPSIMNVDEAEQVVKLVAELLNSGENAEDIIVLAPYVKQVYKIREFIAFFLPTLMRHEMCGPAVLQKLKANCGSVELFQGREAKNVILSCVRSTTVDENIEKDVKRYIGFLAQPQRANVAISRAIDRLWIVANLNLLYRDSLWRQYIRRSLDRGFLFENVRTGDDFRPDDAQEGGAAWAQDGASHLFQSTAIEGDPPFIRAED